MRGFAALFFIFFFLCHAPAHAFFGKKDYKQNFLDDAIKAESRNNDKQAFFSYEKAIYYYKKDRKVIESYAQFCERRKYFDKAKELYEKLYILTKEQEYIFKSNLNSVKSGKVSPTELKKILQTPNLSAFHQHELSSALIYHYFHHKQWKNIKKTCDELPVESIDKEIIIQCMAASSKVKDKQAILKYSLKYAALYPKDSEILNKIVAFVEESGDLELAEKYVQKLSNLNPSDRGIKYRWAGIYERQGKFDKAAKIYEALMASGDDSEHVKQSLAYVLQRKNPPKEGEKENYQPKPLSGYKLLEKNFYDSLSRKDYKVSQDYLDKMLKIQPRNPKLIKHKMDIAFALENYKGAISAFNDFKKVKKPDIEEQKFLAHLYSKSGESEKALDLVDDLYKKSPQDNSLINLALTYAMELKDWDKAIFYNDKLIEIEGETETLLKNKGDFYAIKKDFPSAISSYERLVQLYPNPEYEFELGNFYMANKEFAKAQKIIEPLYLTNKDNPEVVKAYLNTVLAQQKIYEAYQIVKRHKLENTKEGLMIIGDIAFINKDYDSAIKNYRSAVIIDPDDLILQNKVAETYRMMGYTYGPSQIFHQVLAKDPENLEAQLGLGSLEIERKNFEGARDIFKSILRKNPDYRPAKIAMAHSYIAQDHKLSAMEILDGLEQDEEVKLIKAHVYYDMAMWSDSKSEVKSLAGKDAEEIKMELRKNGAIKLIPSYSIFVQQLADAFNLDYNRWGIHLSTNTANNTHVFIDYNIYQYMSGSPYYLTNVTNEIRGGVQSRPVREWEYRADLGVKAFQFGGAMLNTDSWVKYYFNDKFNLKLGFRRNNVEQSYLSAVGEPINGLLTGRVADNRVYLEYEAKLPQQFYSFGRGVYGLMTAQNLPTNQYLEGLIGIGKLFYNNPRNPWIQRAGVDLVSYNSGYQYNLLNLYSNTGVLYGGYFSPGFFTANTCNIKLEGFIKKWHLKYGVTAFGGVQTSEWPNRTTPTWGYGPYASYEFNDHIAINASYNYFNFADVQRHYFTVSAVIRGFKKHAKN